MLHGCWEEFAGRGARNCLKHFGTACSGAKHVVKFIGIVSRGAKPLANVGLASRGARRFAKWVGLASSDADNLVKVLILHPVAASRKRVVCTFIISYETVPEGLRRAIGHLQLKARKFLQEASSKPF